jgi:hypothetical protein
MRQLWGDTLLRAVVDAVQSAGYTAVERQTGEQTNTIQFSAGAGCTPAAAHDAWVTHQPRHRRFQIHFRSAREMSSRQPTRTIYGYYQAHQPSDLGRIARGIAASIAHPMR